MKVGFIGLGNMGQPIASNLIKAGHELTVYNRTKSRAEELLSLGAQVADSPGQAAQEAEVLITMLANDAAVEQVIFGTENSTGAIEELPTGAIHISMSTISAACGQQLASVHAQAGQGYISAPVFGRPEAAAKLWVIAAGDSQQIEQCRPLFDAISQGVFIVGEEPSKANIVKLAGNFMIASMLEAFGESFALMQKSGVEPKQFLEIINTALFKSPIYENYGKLIVEEKYEPAGFKLSLGLKDVRLVLEAAETATVPMPLASIIHDHFLSGVARGYGDIDWAGLGLINALDAGIEQKPDQ
ncbi:2-hydroxy-3-oxopropionate reductase [Crinalium epipsammum PCC 9333]|uniref:2-hydroxy-3-oxopropionate reductase n=1 Tax=Crinalium epipsammum PCC 9333 TaxID=1173022 RepID=K9VWX4_9CYAN|nr:NAD(P)-dependent oxidoreductase [Crinalium epipsammum]AFZ12491.1 2-hydroxy-3-oxopropionate reductase [Crinalium epipsammum PCC 9333]